MNENNNLENNSLNKFLGGQVSLFQPIDGYRANTDSILLAAAVEASPGQSILELGCGVGTVLFSLMARIPDLRVVGVEIQKRYAELATRNAEYNGFKATILDCDLASIPTTFKNLKYDHVILNPPFYYPNGSMRLAKDDKNLAKRELNLSLDDWLAVAVKRCSANGQIVLIQQTARLGQILKCIDSNVGNIKILPISSFKGNSAKRVIVKGKKGSRSPMQILPPLHMHKPGKSDNSRKDYTIEAEEILRDGHAINWQEQN
jgi:tRNA1Val (adenine37-N6)-methyltransferase